MKRKFGNIYLITAENVGFPVAAQPKARILRARILDRGFEGLAACPSFVLCCPV
jgi:hypothetical protein